MRFEETLKQLITDAMVAGGHQTVKDLADVLGVSDRTLHNLRSPKSKTTVSRRVIDHLVKIANYSASKRDEINGAWLEWKLEKQKDGGVGLLMFQRLKKKLKQAEMKRLVDDAIKQHDDHNAK